MSVRIGVCDDNAMDVQLLTEALYKYNAALQITTYSSGNKLLEEWSEHKTIIDILFIDIYMPGLSGIETAAKIRASMKDIIIVFVSSSNEHYPEAFDVFAFNYLLKPVNQQTLNRVLDQALNDLTKERRRQIVFNYKGTTYRVPCRDILFIESNDKLICFHLADKSVLQCYAKLDEILKQLPEDSFIRCHQSFAVNVFHVKEMTENHFRIDPYNINISKKYQKSSKDKYFAYLFSHMNRRTAK